MQNQIQTPPPYNLEAQNIRVPKQPIPNATPTLVLGIISLVFCWMWVLALIGIILGIIGLSMGIRGLSAYNQNPDIYDDSNLGQLKAGRVCCIVSLSISGFFILLILAVFLIAGMAGGFR